MWYHKWFIKSKLLHFYHKFLKQFLVLLIMIIQTSSGNPWALICIIIFIASLFKYYQRDVNCQNRIFHFSTKPLCISSCNMARTLFFKCNPGLNPFLYQISKIITCLLSRGFSSVASIFKIGPRPLRCFEVGMKVHANKFCQTSNSFSAKNMFNSWGEWLFIL